MKKTHVLVTVILAACSTGFGQVDIKLWDNGSQSATGNNLNGTEYTHTVSSDDLHTVTFNFKNTSASTKDWKIERYRIVDLASWNDQLRWYIPNDPVNGQCYSSGQMVANPWITPLGLTVNAGESANLMAEVTTQGPGMEKYRYYLIEGQNTRVDSVDLVVTSTLGLSDQETASVSVYPNPVSNVLTVNTTGLEGSVELKLVDVLGKVVLTESGAPMNKVDVSSFKNGVYLVYVYNKGNLIQTKRIVIKH